MGSPWLAGIGGALGGIDQAMLRQQLEERQQRQAELQIMLEQIRSGDRQNNEQGREDRADKGIQAKKDIAVLNNDTRRAGQQKVDDRFWGGTLPFKEEALETNDATKRAGQQQVDDRFWGGTLPLQEEALSTHDATQRYGINRRAETAAQGQNLAHGDRQDALASTDDARAMRSALDAYGKEIQRRKAARPSGAASLLSATPPDAIPTFGEWVQSSDDPAILPSVRRQFGGGDGVPPAQPNQKSSPFPARPQASAPGSVPVGSALETQMRQLVSQIRAADASGADSTALRQQLAALRAQVR